MKTRVARFRVVKRVREQWFFEVPPHVSPDDVATYVREQEFLTNTPPASQMLLESFEDNVTFVDMPVPMPNRVIRLDPDYTGWPPPLELVVGQCIWWEDTSERDRSGWVVVRSVGKRQALVDVVEWLGLGPLQVSLHDLSLVQPA